MKHYKGHQLVRRYGTKNWAKWASQKVDLTLELLKEPDRKWDAENTHLEFAAKVLVVIKTELERGTISHKSCERGIEI